MHLHAPDSCCNQALWHGVPCTGAARVVLSSPPGGPWGDMRARSGLILAAVPTTRTLATTRLLLSTV